MTPSTAAIRAELFKLTRRRPLIAAILVAIGLGMVSSLGVFLAAGETGGSIGTGAGEAPSLSALADPGGATRPLGIGVSFVGGITVALVGASVAAEFSHGTMRTLLLHQPHRSALLVGKLAGLLAVAWTTLALALVVTIVSSVGFAAVQDVPTRDWFGVDGFVAALGDYLSIGASLTGWALLGTTLGTLLRSVPLTLGVGVAWIGPLEHITSDAWNGAFDWYPGLLLENVLVGGTDDVGIERSLSLATVYAIAAMASALLFLRHRDITS